MPRPILFPVTAGLLAAACGTSSAHVVSAPARLSVSRAAVTTTASPPTTGPSPTTGPTTTTAVARASRPTPHPTRTAKPVPQVGSCRILSQAEAEALLGPVDPIPRVTGDNADTCTRLATDINRGAVEFGKGNASYAAGLAGVSASFLAAFKGPNTGGAKGTVTPERGLGGGGVLLTERDPGRPPTYSVYWLQSGRILNLNVVHAPKATPAGALHLAHLLAADAG